MGPRIMVSCGSSLGKAGNAEVVIVASAMGASYTDLCTSCQAMKLGKSFCSARSPPAHRPGHATEALTVLVISAEHTSQMYLTPPSVPRVIVFFLMTPILTLWEVLPGVAGCL